MRFFKAIITTFFVLFHLTLVHAGLPLAVNGQALPSLAPMLKEVMPAVVNISTQGRFEGNSDPFSQPARERVNPSNTRGKRFESMGSGVIVDAKNGIIVTNAHLTDQAKIINVTLSDGRRTQARLIGQDIASDIAIIQIKANNLTALKFADSSAVQTGDFVVAIGNPYGLTQSVTSGVVSAAHRNDLGIEGYEDFIQTDASINPGNSGGALVNLKGQLIGINTAILAPNGGNIGIGFAIPSDMAESIMNQLIKYGSLGRGVAGIMIQTLTPEIAEAIHQNAAKGAVISQVTTNSPAHAAGLQIGDIIQKINGHEITTGGQVKNAIGLLRAGTKVNLEVLRNNRVIAVNLITTDPGTFEEQNKKNNPFLFGLILKNFTAEVPLLGDIQGVQIVQINDTTAAWQAGLREGDIITSANLTAIRNIQQLDKIAQNAKDKLLLNIYRKGGAAFFVITP